MANYIQDYLYSELPQELLVKYVKWEVMPYLRPATEADLMTVAVVQKDRNNQVLYITQEKDGDYVWVEMFKSPVPVVPTKVGAYALNVTSKGNFWEEIKLPEDGVGIYNVKIDSEGTYKGHLIVTLTDGKVIDAGKTIGEQGVGVEKIRIDSEGNFIVLYTDGDSEIAGTVKGEKGDIGPDGVSIKSANVTSEGHLIITLTNDLVIDAGYTLGPRGPEGPQGERGLQGADGKEGVSVVDAYIRSDLKLILILSDSTEIVTDRVVGPQGRQGPEGPIGPKGSEGPVGPAGRGISDVDIDIDGNLRIKYTDGTTDNLGSVIGPQGSEGPQGEPGIQGADGASVNSAEVNSEGILTLILTDGTPIIVQGSVKGDTGPAGEQGPQGSEGPIGPQGSEGVGIQSVSVDSSGDLIVLLSNGSNIDAGKVVGPQGSEGVGIERIDILLDDSVVIVLTDGRTKNLGVLKGEKGDRGSEGPAGSEGPQGEQGPQGEPGKGIAGISCYYAVSTTQSAPTPESITATAIPTLTSIFRYLWQKQIIVYTDGTLGEPIVLLIGVYGDKGEPGSAGATGPQGPAGERGPAGPQGSEGPQGPAGERGPAGPRGSEGPMGPQGSEGTSIAAANIASGNLIITLTDGTTIDAGPVIAAPTIPAPTEADEVVALCWNYLTNSMEWVVVKKPII